MELFAKFVELRQDGIASMQDISANHADLSSEGKKFDTLVTVNNL